MKTLNTLNSIFVALLFLSPACIAAEEGVTEGEIAVTGQVIDGDRDSAKYEEYREVPEGASTDLSLSHKQSDGYFFELDADDVAEDDQSINASIGKYGHFALDAGYDETPHNFAYDALSLYSGIGTDNLVLDDSLQSDLQNNATSVKEIADKLNTDYLPGAIVTDIKSSRKKAHTSLEVTTFEPVSLTLELDKEEKTGTRPLGVSFGFGNALEALEPINWDTTNFRATAEYAEDALYFSAQYYLSIFENNYDNLNFDNPFRVSDATAPAAYLDPRDGTDGLVNSSASRGLYDLAPDNDYNNVALNGVISDLPLNSRLALSASWGWMRQNSDLDPYTSNTAIDTGSTAHLTRSSASLLSSLPYSEVDAKVNTALYNIQLSSDPLEMMDFKLRWRMYDYDNRTDMMQFPGYVRFDSVWEEMPVENYPSDWKKSTVDMDLGFDVIDDAKLGLSYRYQNMDRSLREVEESDEHLFKAAIDTTPCKWFDMRGSYEHSFREVDNYDYTVPFGYETVTSQLPFLRKYDQADRVRDRFQVLASVYPMEELSFTTSVIYGMDDYDESDFGLLENEHVIYALDVDYAASRDLNLFAFWSREEYENEQLARQWASNGFSDPYVAETGLASDSNWTAKNNDTTQTVGAGVSYALLRNKLNFDITYSYSNTDGSIGFYSPLGVVDANPYDPADYTEVDDIVIQSVNPRFTYTFNKNFDLVLGYIWESFEADDYDERDFVNVATNTNGYNGGLYMGTLPYADYEVNLFYGTVKYHF